MRRRSLLLTGSTVLGLAGCLDGNEAGDRVEEKPYPDRPDELTAESALEYVRAYEEARVYNEHVDDDAISLSVGCDAVLDRTADDTFYVVSRCFGTLEAETGGLLGIGGTVGHYDLETPPTTTLVDRDGRERFDRVGYAVAAREGDAPRLYLANVDDDAHEVAVTVAPADGTGEPAFDGTFELEPGTAHLESGVVPDGGDEAYAIDVRLERGSAASHEWERDEAALEGEPSLPDVGVYVTPAGDLDVDTLADEWARPD